MNPLDLLLSRRNFLRRSTAVGAAAAAGAVTGGMLATTAYADSDAPFEAASPNGPAPGPALDAAILKFALNLEYLEAEYYLYATTGMGLEAAGVDVTGTGRPGATVVKANPMVTFGTPAIASYAAEIADDEKKHVIFLRTALQGAGVTPSARPSINLLDSFNTLAVAAGIGSGFDPFANEVNFLLGAFIFEDVGVTAYRGAAPLITKKAYLSAAAGILGTEAYHAAEIRTVLTGLAANNASILDTVQKISDLRDALDGGADRDQALTLTGAGNIVPTDDNAIVFKRNTAQVLNIVYGDTTLSGTPGLFFPNGMNGRIK